MAVHDADHFREVSMLEGLAKFLHQFRIALDVSVLLTAQLIVVIAGVEGGVG